MNWVFDLRLLPREEIPVTREYREAPDAARLSKKRIHDSLRHIVDHEFDIISEMIDHPREKCTLVERRTLQDVYLKLDSGSIRGFALFKLSFSEQELYLEIPELAKRLRVKLQRGSLPMGQLLYVYLNHNGDRLTTKEVKEFGSKDWENYIRWFRSEGYQLTVDGITMKVM